MSDAVVQLSGVGTSFFNAKTGRDHHILADINAEVHAGEILCVVGPSGCGKSTLLNGIGGFRPFSRGRALLAGQPIGPPDRQRGVVFQDYPIFEFLTAAENVALGLDLEAHSLFENLLPLAFRRHSKKHLTLAREHLASVGLDMHADKYPRQLSGGQKQRVAIAQAIAMKPKILLMDEPFSGLDPDTREKLQLVVLALHRELHNTVFFVTHDLEEAVFVGNRVIVLSQFSPGRTPEQGATIVHEQELKEYKDAGVKETAEFARLIALLRSKFHPAATPANS